MSTAPIANAACNNPTGRASLSVSEQALRWHARFGRNPSSLVTFENQLQLFEHPSVDGAVPYHSVGPVWLAGEPLVTAESMRVIMAQFVHCARRHHRVPLFAPVGPLASDQADKLGFQRVRLGATPYLSLPAWHTRGRRMSRLRGALHQALRAGVTVEEWPTSAAVQGDLAGVGQAWLDSRRAGTPFGWIFRLAPQQHASLKRLFVACLRDGEPLAFLSCSPLPARCGWYLEDVVRAPHCPSGTAACLVAHAIEQFRAEGALWATLGGVPLATSPSVPAGGALNVNWLRRPLSRWYHFEGVALFKAQFGAQQWETEELLLPAWSALPLAAWAVVRLALPGGLASLR